MVTQRGVCCCCQQKQLHDNDSSHITKSQVTLHIHGNLSNHGYHSILTRHWHVIAVLCLCFSLFHRTGALLYKVPVYKLDARLNAAVLVPPSDHKPYVRSAPAQSGKLIFDADRLQGQPGEGYYVKMAIGTPPQIFNVLVDTGSSNFAIAAANDPAISSYFNISQSSTFWSSGFEVSVPYTMGNWVGLLGQEVVSMDSMHNVSIEVSMAFITESENFFINASQWQGILGLAYAEIARPDSSEEPFFDALVHQTDISDVFSIQLCGTEDIGPDNIASMAGNMVLGGVDESLYTGDVYYVPIYKEWYYEVVITDISVQGISVDMDCKEYNFDKTIVDSGTTNLRLPKRVFSQVLLLIQQNTHLAGQEVPDLFWSGDDILCWPAGDTPWFSFPSLEISLASGPNSTITLTLSPHQYLRAVADQDVEDATIAPQNDCYKFAVSSSETGAVLGAVVMEAFYVIFDREEKRIGFAVNTCKNKAQNALLPSISGPLFHDDTMDCAYFKPDENPTSLLIVAYVMAGICGICLLPLVIMFVYWQVTRCRQQRTTSEPQNVTDDEGLLDDGFLDR